MRKEDITKKIVAGMIVLAFILPVVYGGGFLEGSEAIGDNTIEQGYLKYEITSSEQHLTVEVTGVLEGYPDTIDIPPTVKHDGEDYTVTSIGFIAFFDCTSLTSVNIPDGVTNIGDMAFDDCTSLTAINVDSNNETFGSVDGILFVNNKTKLILCPCGRTAPVTIPDGVTEIDNAAFYNCASLTSVNIPDSVTSISYSSFRGCASLKAINVDSNNETFCSVDGILFNKNKTKLILCPGGRTAPVTLPNGVTEIDYGAFYECASLTSVNIPDSVTSIGDSSFFGCASLTSVNIPNGVTSIEKYTFHDCASLTSVIIPENVESIRYYAFGNCSQLASVYVKSVVPPTLDEAVFVETDEKMTIYVPKDCAEDYKGAKGWMSLKIEPLKTADVPVAVRDLVYNGSEQTGVPADDEKYTITGNKATDVGTYTATATLKEGYIWSDGTFEPKQIKWSIGATPESDGDNGLSPWAIVLIAIVIILVILALTYYFLLYKKGKSLSDVIGKKDGAQPPSE